MIERERKYRLSASDFERLKETLGRSARLERREIQETIHFADASGRSESLNLRLRVVDERQELTVKGPRLEAGPSKVRMEHTVVLAGDPAPILAALGLAPTERYRKRTAIYALDGALVSLDEVDGLGRFCEIEAADDLTIQLVADRLALRGDSLEPRGYARLLRQRAKDGAGEVK